MDEHLANYRREKTREFGAATLDNAVAAYFCRRCGTDVADQALRVVADVGYGDLESFGKAAKKVAKGVSGRDLPACPTCGIEAGLKHLDLHGFHQPADRDVVARATSPRGLLSRQEVAFYWWSPEQGLVRLTEFTAEEESGFLLSALVRRAEVVTMLEDPEIERLVTEGRKALRESPGHPLLLDLIPVLLSIGRSSLGGAIAEAHIQAWPKDARGHAWLGQILFMAINHGVMPAEDLEEAIGSLNQALELDPEDAQAAFTMGNCHRFRGDQDSASAIYKDLLKKRPDFAIAHYNLGLIALESGDAEGALEQFRQGESIEAEDADYPVGAARALLSQGRFDEARLALDRARVLDPEHRLVPTLEEVLLQADGPAN